MQQKQTIEIENIPQHNHKQAQHAMQIMREIVRLQHLINGLMLHYCPHEVSPQQKAEYDFFQSHTLKDTDND